MTHSGIGLDYVTGRAFFENVEAASPKFTKCFLNNKPCAAYKITEALRSVLAPYHFVTEEVLQSLEPDDFTVIAHAYCKKLPAVAVKSLPCDNGDKIIKHHRKSLRRIGPRSVQYLLNRIQGWHAPWITPFALSSTYMLAKVVCDRMKSNFKYGVDDLVVEAWTNMREGEPMSEMVLGHLIHVLIMQHREHGEILDKMSENELKRLPYPRSLTKRELKCVTSLCKNIQTRAELQTLVSFPAAYGLDNEHDVSSSVFFFVQLTYKEPWRLPVIVPYRAQLQVGPGVSYDTGYMVENPIQDDISLVPWYTKAAFFPPAIRPDAQPVGSLWKMPSVEYDEENFDIRFMDFLWVEDEKSDDEDYFKTVEDVDAAELANSKEEDEEVVQLTDSQVEQEFQQASKYPDADPGVSTNEFLVVLRSDRFI
ncbi:hypothetical protein TKK_0003041 [Trichogramma kaykai]